jgi:RimJ/RimL family protein N-acetyltransferase
VNISPITLSGRHVELRPLSLEDVTALCAVGLDEDLWRWIPTQVRNRDEMERYVRTALTEQREGRALPLTQSGRWRDSVYFSILAQDWPGVREALERKVRV